MMMVIMTMIINNKCFFIISESLQAEVQTTVHRKPMAAVSVMLWEAFITVLFACEKVLNYRLRKSLHK